MITVLFVCTGNICRSPMAEAVMEKLIQENGLTDKISVDSAGIISFHQGAFADDRALQELARHNIHYEGCSRQVEVSDFNKFEYMLGMNRGHVRDLETLMPQGSTTQLHYFLEFATDVDVKDVPDPYYDGNFEYVYELIEKGCHAFLAYLKQTHPELR